MPSEEFINKFLTKNYKVVTGSDDFLILDKYDNKLWSLVERGFHWHLKPILGAMDKPTQAIVDAWIEAGEKEIMTDVVTYIQGMDTDRGSYILEEELVKKFEFSIYQQSFLSAYFNRWYYNKIMLPRFSEYISGLKVTLGPRSWLPFKIDGKLADIQGTFLKLRKETPYQQALIIKRFDDWLETEAILQTEKTMGINNKF